ncbi:hypothetical protein GW17_00004146 [Ensete ventricosum]|nr:hypothetical protein GW17_00004146 [Ensete ventricosum]
MASERQRETISLGKRRPVEAGSREEDEAGVVENEEEDENRDIQELEREVSEMGRRILDARRSIPDRLLEALSTRLLTQRPVLPPQALISADAGTTGTFLVSFLPLVSCPNPGTNLGLLDKTIEMKTSTWTSKIIPRSEESQRFMVSVVSSVN